MPAPLRSAVAGRFVVAGCLAGVLLTGASRARADEVIDRVMAVVGGNLILQSDVTAAHTLGFVSPGAGSDPAKAVLSALIDRALILAEVERYAPPEPAVEAIDRDVQVVRARFATQAAFDSALARVGLNPRRLRSTVRENLRIQQYLDQRFVVPTPNDEELGRYYREHQASYVVGGQAPPFQDVHALLVQAWTAAHRATLVGDWVAGLRKRNDVLELSGSPR